MDGKYTNYSLYSFEIRRDVISGRLRTSLQVTIKRVFRRESIYCILKLKNVRNLPQIRNDIMSNLEVGQSVD